MNPSQQVTLLRKDGRLDEAYGLALELVTAPTPNAWEWAAYAWCLIDLIKRHAADGDQARLGEYIDRLSAFEVPSGNDLLAQHRERALELGNEDRRAILEARRLGKNGQHEQAVGAFAKLLPEGSFTDDDKTAFGWELFRAAGAIRRGAGGKDLPQAAIGTIRRHLNTYFKLGLSGPSLLHSCVLQQAQRLAHEDHLRLIAFVRLWNLENLRPEDYEKTTSEDGKVFPALAEQVLQRASKEAAKGASAEEMAYIAPYVETALKRYPDNVWLKLNMVKLLRGLDRPGEARQLAVEFARNKAGEFWTWDLLGDLEADRDMRLSCYAKGLSCSEDDVFVSKLRLKFARLVSADFPGQAKAEVERVVAHKQKDGLPLSSDAQQLANSAWFASTTPVPSGRAFYNRFKGQAEELLFAQIPWTDACLGDRFVIDGVDGQKSRSRRHIYVMGEPLPLELSVSATHPDVRDKSPGTPIKLQMETPMGEPWRTTVHRIQSREDGEPYDVMPELCGVIDHVNPIKGLLHFVVATDVDGTCPIAEFAGAAEPGMAVAVRMAHYHSRKGLRPRVVSILPTTRTPESDICKAFSDTVEVRNGLGFTSAKIFIPPDLVADASIAQGDLVEGMAVINFDKKRNAWGWKAIRAKVA